MKLWVASGFLLNENREIIVLIVNLTDRIINVEKNQKLAYMNIMLIKKFAILRRLEALKI